ncbi:MAG TPA: tripartite tricarboxylate transporter permease [Geminicoccaceae bacterium]
MEALDLLLFGFSVALTPQNLALALLGAFLGTIIGALPGLGPTNGVAILIPLAFSLNLVPASALILLASVYYGAMYGGRISSILLNIPGDEPALMTTLDGYPMARQGKAGEALAISAIASFIGGFIATVGLLLFAPLLAKFALLFGPAEYFALFVLAFTTIGGLTSRNQMKSLMAAALGLMIGTVGLEHGTGIPRYTFNHMELFEGIDFLVAIVGMFAISEILFFIEERAAGRIEKVELSKARVTVEMLRTIAPTTLRGSVIGFVCGVLPGAGASLGSFAAYTLEKRFFDRRGTFGTGDPRGVAAPEAGNNGAAGGALIPMLTLGVPGSGTTAVLLAMLMAMNITPGPLLFQENPDVVWGLIAALFIGNFMLLVMNLPMVGLFARVLMVPSHILMPIVGMVGFVGIYSISHSLFDLYLMIAFGVGGYILRKMEVPLVPVILGLLLGTLMEENLRRALNISNGDWTVLVSSPLAIGLWVFALVGLLVPVVFGKFLRPSRPGEAAAVTD